MATFGHYETVSELHRTALTTVFSGHDQASLADEFAIKVFRPFVPLSEADETRNRTELFLSAVRSQQKVISAGARHWSRIHECGTTADGGFYVSDRYPRSLKQLIDGHIKLAGPGLFAIIEPVAKGLLELKQTSNRPHGNLKATNILIAGEGELSHSRVVLSDLLPDEYVGAEVNWSTDLRALGELMYQLISHRPAPEVDGWQVPASKEWSRLGKDADKWRQLCSRLLNARTAADAMTIEALLGELAQFKKAKPVVARAWLLAAAILFVGIGAYYLLKKPPPPPADAAVWQNVREKYTHWAEAFCVGVLQLHNDKLFNKNGLAQRWCTDPNLADMLDMAKKPIGYIVDEVEDAGGIANLDPNDLDGTRINDASAAIEHIEDYFDPNSQRLWSVLAGIKDAAEDYQKRKWDGASDYMHGLTKKVNLKGMIEGMEPDEDRTKKVKVMTKFATDVSSILTFDAVILRSIRANMTVIKTHRETITENNTSTNVTFDDDWVNDRVREALATDGADLNILSILSEKLEKIAENGGKLVDFLNMLNKLSDAFSDANDYVGRAKIASLEEHDACKRSIDQLLAEFEAIQEVEVTADNVQEFREQADKLEPALLELRQRVDRASVPPEDFVADIKSKNEVSIASDTSINGKWVRLRDDLLERYPLREISKKENGHLYSELWGKIADTNDNLLALDAEIKRRLSSQIPAEELKEKKWNSEIAQFYDRKRDETISRIVADIPMRDGIPDINDSSFAEFRDAQFTKFGRIRNDLGGILGAFNQIEDRLEACYLLDDKPRQGDRTVRSLWDEWRGNETLNDPSVGDILAGLRRRLEDVNDINNLADKQNLTAKVTQDAKVEVLYAVWDRLGKLSEPWPAERTDWEDNQKIQAWLKLEFQRIRDQVNRDRGDELLKILATEAIARHETTVVNNAHGDKVLQQFRGAKAFGPDPDLAEIEASEELAGELASFAIDPNWPGDYRTDLLWKENPQLYDDAVSDPSFRDWLRVVKGYQNLKKEEDPRPEDETKLNEFVQMMEELISGATRTVQQEEGFKTERQAYESTRRGLEKILGYEAIKKHKQQIAQFDSLLEKLLGHEKTIRLYVKPARFEFLEISDGKIVFGGEKLRIFDPVKMKSTVKSNMPGAEAAPRKAEFEPLRAEKWDDMWDRTDRANPKYVKEYENCFALSKDSNGKSVAWPMYIRSRKDDRVILRFIPAESDGDKPFYIGVYEITNAQYRLFVKRDSNTTSESYGTIIKLTHKNNANERSKVLMMFNQDTAGAGTYDEQGGTNKDIPVTWVTFTGAKLYNEWLFGGSWGRLPTAREHKFACWAQSSANYPWGDDRNSLHAHLRAKQWKDEAIKYNERRAAAEKDAGVAVPAKPIGALVDSLEGKLLNAENVFFDHQTHYDSAWPASSASQANGWGLYDMVGNVWEWCTDEGDGGAPVICGGSCLAPEEDVPNKQSVYARRFTVTTATRAADVGFRVAVTAE